MNREKLELIRRTRSMFGHITPFIPDFDAFTARGGDGFAAVQDTAAIIASTEKLIPPRYQKADATDERVLGWVDKVVSQAKPSRLSHVPYLRSGPSLLLLGPTGVGKTHQAYGALRRLSIIGIGCAPVAASITDVFAKMRPRPGIDSEAIFRSYANAPLAFIDDLGAAKATEWNEEVTYRLVNFRYEHRLSTIFTSNAPPKVLANRVGERVASRLTEMARRVPIKGVDRRLGGIT
ncbi:ATP-binding protein [Nocardiopsis alba]|uniref:ATP-binding protein n=1 Tax=Nocardiopsis alba TaxID=53437 RepID=UPI0033B819DF